jgi:Leucine-rich repeat (LRR) protein
LLNKLIIRYSFAQKIKAMQQYLNKSFLGIFLLFVVNCRNYPSSDNLSPIVNEGNNINTQPKLDAVISLENLDGHAADNIWEQFFEQRAANKIWQMLQRARGEKLYFHLSKAQQINEVIVGSIKYLSLHQIPLKTLSFVMNKNEKPISLPPEIGILTNLRILNLSINKLLKVEIPYEVINLKSLQELCLANNHLTVISPNIANLINLTELDLSYNKLAKVPLEITKLKKLSKLDLSSNLIQEIPDEINNLTNLLTLEIDTNQLTTFPAIITQLINLNNLSIAGNQIKDIPSSICNLINLKSLDLSYNQIKQIPPQISYCTKLQLFRLSNNQLQQIPAEFCNLINLNYLRLIYNKLKTIPAEIGILTNLQIFEVSHNRLECIPSQIGSCNKLTEIDFSYNKIKELPRELDNLINLKKLNLSRNKVKFLPAELPTIPKLTMLDLTSNQLTRLPACMFFTFTNLKFDLLFDNNPWLKPSDSSLQEFNSQEIGPYIYKQFPHSLTILCLQYLEDHSHLFAHVELESKLPKELYQVDKRYLLKNTYQWDTGRDIVFFETVNKRNLPLSINYPLASLKVVKSILETVGKKPLYKVTSYN